MPAFEFNNKRRLINTIKTLFFLRRTIKRIHPYSILSFGELWNSFVLLSLYGLKCKVFISDRCQPDKKFSRFHDRLRKLLYPGATGIVAQTGKAKEIYHTQFIHNNIRVIGNPIRVFDIPEGINKEKVVLMVGRLIETKHQDKLIEMFLRISKPGWKLILVGYDHLKQNISHKLRQIIKENHAEKYVILAGKQNNVEQYYAKAEIFAFTSSSEGFPNVIGEAMSAGLPVIAFDCVAGPSEMISDNQNGFLIPLFDYTQFQTKFEQLMEDEDLRIRLGKNAKEDIRKYSISSIGEQYINFILN
jgi:glycosyltransferase involved in cell wall biosynthesis